MIAPLGHGEVREIALALQRACGVVFPDHAGEQVRSGIARAAETLGVAPGVVLARVRRGDAAAVCALIEGSVVGETYFSRHPEQLAALRDGLRREGEGRPVRAWCAGCASGEEAYTIAALLLEDGRAGSAVLASDVSEKALRAARTARYGAWSLRGLPAAVRLRWLRPAGEHWTVAPEIRALVSFARHNLVTDPPPGPAFDVVSCRNVLIYFDRPTADAVVRKLFDAVRPGGLVALAPAENFLAQPLGYEAVEQSGGAVWRKSPAPTGPRVRTAPPARSPGAPRRPASGPRPVDTAPSAPPSSGSEGPDGLAEARRAAAEGRWADAERLAAAAGEAALRPEPFLFAAAVAEAGDDVDGAVRWIRRALFLDPGHAVARASLVPLLERTGRRDEAARARRQALEALEPLADDALLPGIEPVAVGALRAALAGPRRPEVPW